MMVIFCEGEEGASMGDKPDDRRARFTVIQGGKSDDAAPQPSSEFNIHAFMSQEDLFDFSQFKVPPEYYGKTINGVQYGDPTKQPVLLYVDESGKPVFEY